ncbi:MAG: DUF4124 domain-containing protein [Pseudomonadota bacterium]
MNNFSRSSALRLMAGGALLLLAGLAQAQYMWIDAKGVKQLSDRPPPPDTPKKDILRQPGGVPDALEAVPSETVAAPKLKGPPTLAERNQDFAKRGKEAAERDKKAGEEALQKAELKENCDAAREAKMQIDSGVRITSSKNGERGFMDDAERAQRVAKANKVLEGCH